GTVARFTPQRALQPARFAIVPPPALSLATIGGGDRDIAITPDGTRIVYRTTGQQLVVRAIDRLETTPLSGVADAQAPFISPDGQWVGFFTANALKKVSIAGGPSITLCRVTGTPLGASWGDDGTIVFATTDRTTGLMSVP